MLTITRAQIDQFDHAVAARFEAEMRDHVRAFAPAVSKTLGDEGVATFTRHGIERAGYYGLTRRGPIRLFLELALLRGSYFDTDPQYPEYGAALRGGGEDMDRAEVLHSLAENYLQSVVGAQSEIIVAALQKLSELSDPPERGEHPTELDAMIDALAKVYPEKMASMGRLAFGRLVLRARGVVARLGAKSRSSEWTMVILMLFFGHGCISDPLYPWIANTLYRPDGGDADQRIALAGRKARAWMDAVLDRHAKGKPI